MGRPSLYRESLDRVLEAREDSGRRFVDLCLVLKDHDTGTELVRVGGRWDRRARAYDGPAATARVITVHRGQRAAAVWLADWLRRRATGDWEGVERVWSLLYVGGRRGGKSHMAVDGVCLFSVLMPGSLSWAVSPTQEETDELDRAIRSTLPASWYRYRGDPRWEYQLVNGSTIRMLSGFKPSTLRRGGVDFALYNEAQRMPESGFVQLRGATSDTGGLTIATANPPDSPIGQWVADRVERARASLIKATVFDFDPRLNQFIEYQSLADLESEVDDVTFRRDVLGEFVPIGDRVFHAWSDALSIADPPAHLVDVTAELTRPLGRSVRHIIGADFQKTPHMAAVVLKAYRDPADEEKAILLWIVDEVVVADADEDDLVDGLERPTLGVRCPCCPETAEGYTPADSVVIADASGDWQDAERTKGRGSYDWFRKRGWLWVYPPDRRMKKNPEIGERVKAANALLRARNGRRRLFSCPHNEQTNRAMKYWENKNGQPHRRSDHAHIADAVTYPVWNFFPRRRDLGGDIDIKIIKRPTRSRWMEGW